MNQDQWTAVDRYFSRELLPADPVLEAALKANAAAGLPSIDVSPTQGKLLHLLAAIHGARRILEIGTLGGYSTIWLARALPSDGVLVTLEYEPKHAEVAQQNIDRAGLGQKVHILVGRALELLPGVANRYPGAFDLVFIDADKPNSPAYLEWALKLSRPGTVIVVDNVVRKGELANADSSDPNVQAMRKVTEMIGASPRLFATGIQTVGQKGYDGFLIARVSST